MSGFFARPIFHGARFDSHLLPMEWSLFREIQAYRNVILEFAIERWRAEHPKRTRLPRGMRDFVLGVQRVDPHAGCTALDLWAMTKNGQLSLPFADFYTLGRDDFYRTLDSLGSDDPMPFRLSGPVDAYFRRLGANLREGERVVFASSPYANDGRVFERRLLDRLPPEAARSHPGHLEILREVPLSGLASQPQIVRCEGSLSRVSFEESAGSIALRSAERVLSFSATQEQVARAVSMPGRKMVVTALVLGTSAKVLRIDEPTCDIAGTAEERTEFIISRWDGAMAKLAQ